MDDDEKRYEIEVENWTPLKTTTSEDSSSSSFHKESVLDESTNYEPSSSSNDEHEHKKKKRRIQKKKRDPNAPKRPMLSFFQYVNEKRDEMKRNNQD